MDLQGYGTFAFANFFIGQIDHLRAVQEGLHMVALYPDAEFVPFGWFQNVFFLVGNLHQPVPAVGFINTARIMIRWSNFYLPATNFGAFDGRAEKYATVAVGFLL